MAASDKKPVQVYLDATQRSKLSYLAERLNVSYAEVLRMGIDALSRATFSVDDDPAMQLIGLLGEQTNSPGDMSVAHDRYIVEETRNV
ncbi:MAG: hypothetical protein WHX52_00565 [Anaerolineae bacterium]